MAIIGDGVRPGVTPVVYIAGAGRSGSTLLANLLGSVSGLTSVGELRFLWERGIGEQARCGCGATVPTCTFWRAVLMRAYGSDVPDVASMVSADRHLLRLRSLRALTRADPEPGALGADAEWYLESLVRIYQAASAESGGVLVDSSKLVGFGYLLQRSPAIDLHVVHLVRDPRGVAHSWNLSRGRDDRGLGSARMRRERVSTSAALWDVHNAGASRLFGANVARYARVRYEDLVADPRAALTPVMHMLGLAPETLPISDDDAIRLIGGHTVAGNPNRMVTGRTRLRPDVTWQSAMPIGQRVAVTTICSPLLHQFGYPIIKAGSTDQGEVPGRVEARRFLEDMRGPRRFVVLVGRNLRWMREQGIARVLEEKEIDPIRVLPVAARKWRYRRNGATPRGQGIPVFLVGLQRSGTNMLLRGVGAAPQVEVHNENDHRAFDRYKLKSLDVIEEIVTSSRHSHVLFKPLCDSHRIDQILDTLRTERPGRAVWAYRDVDGRVRSALAKFGDGNLQVLREFASGVNTTRWHVQRISDESAKLVRSFDFESLSAESGAALMWLIRNRLYFELGLDKRDDVHLMSYESMLSNPERTMSGLCDFLGFPYDASLVRHVTGREPTYRDPLKIDPVIRAHCDDLARRLRERAAVDQSDDFRIASER